MFEICFQIIQRQRDGKSKPGRILKTVGSGDRYVPAGSVCLSFYLCKCLKFSIIKIKPKGKKKKTSPYSFGGGYKPAEPSLKAICLLINLKPCISVGPVIPKPTEALTKEPKPA